MLYGDIRKLIEEQLRKICIHKGDIILVHTDFSVIRGIYTLNWSETFSLMKSCFLNVLGEEGTLIVPTFNWDFCKGKAYIHEKTRSQVGMFTNYILNDASSVRSFHPIYSFTGIGKKKHEILNNVSKSSFGEGSVFERLYNLNAKIILFNFDLGSTFVHYVEQKIGVNYRYLKNFDGEVSKNGISKIDSFDFYVRRLDYDVSVDLSKLHETLRAKKKMEFKSINNKYNLMQFKCNDIYDIIEKKFETDPFFLLSKPLSIPD